MNRLETIVNQINSEIVRLDAQDTEDNCAGIACYPDESLPEGWVRMDGFGASPQYGPAEEVLAYLRGVEYNRASGANGWELAIEALPSFSKPDNSRDWPKDLIAIEQIEDGDANDNPNTLVTIQTNSGTRYAAGPHGVSCCALEDWLDADSTLATTREQAISQGCEQKA